MEDQACRDIADESPQQELEHLPHSRLVPFLSHTMLYHDCTHYALASILRGYISPTSDRAFVASRWGCARMQWSRKFEHVIDPASFGRTSRVG